MKKGHFRLTCVAQKRCCLSSLLLVVSGVEVVLNKIGIIFTLKVNFSFISATVLAEVAHSVQFCP